MEPNQRIETELEVRSYLQNLRYALDNGGKITIQMHRKVDEERDSRYTNSYTIADLVPDQDPETALKEEIRSLTIKEYIQTVKDTNFPARSEMRVFGRVYNGSDDVYIKIRVEVLSETGSPLTFVMSFHYAVTPFTPDMFPYGGGAK